MIQQIIDTYRFVLTCPTENPICNIDKSLTPLSGLFILCVICFTCLSYLYLRKRISNVSKKFFTMGIGVLMFELFTAPMWNSYNLGTFGYYYLDLSFIPTIYWTSMFIINIYIIDNLFKKKKEWQKFFLSLPIPLIFIWISEIIMVAIGIRSYAPEVIETSISQPLGVPIEVIYYAPVFAAFIISFYKFWCFYLEKIPIVPMKKKVTVRNFLIAFIGIFMFELLIEPLVENVNFPSWSYLYQDISFIRILIWIVLIASITTFIDKLIITINQFHKYFIYIILTSLIFFQMESWMITNGHRIYSQSAAANFTGISTPISNIPIEVALAIPLYLGLIIPFIRYWRIVWDNKL